MRERISKEDLELLKLRVLEEYKKTQVIADIARNLGLPVGRMNYYARAWKLQGVGRSNSELQEAILEEYKTTQNLAQIARNLSLTRSQMGYYAKKLSLKGIKESNIIWVDDVTVQCSKCSKHVLFSELDVLRPNSDKPQRLSYCRQCRTKQIINNTNSSLEAYFRNRIRTIRARSKFNGLEHNIDVNDLVELYSLQKGKCFYTDEILVVPKDGKLDTSKSTRHSLSLDKIIPSKGYIKGNIVLCTKRANTIKGDLSPDEMKKWLPVWRKRLLKHGLI